jgi:hypothetical protein
LFAAALRQAHGGEQPTESRHWCGGVGQAGECEQQQVPPRVQRRRPSAEKRDRDQRLEQKPGPCERASQHPKSRRFDEHRAIQ